MKIVECAVVRTHFGENMKSTAQLLVQNIDLRKQLEDRIKTISAPYDEIKKEALADLPDALKNAKDLESETRKRLAEEYSQANDERQANLLAGTPQEPLTLEGLTVKWIQKVEASGPFDFQNMLARGLLVPDAKAIERELKAGNPVTGYTLKGAPSFVRKK